MGAQEDATADLDERTTKLERGAVTAQERAAWSGKQDAVSDLSQIRSNATKGATAIQLTDTVSVGDNEYTVGELLTAVAQLMGKTIVTHEDIVNNQNNE